VTASEAMSKSMEAGWAVIPAAGSGSRLRPHTHTTPKALLNVAGKPILGHILDEVSGVGIRKVVLVVGAYGDRIVSFVRSHYDFDEVVSVIQEEPEGLGQAVFLTRSHVDGCPALIIYGDTVFDCDLREAVTAGGDGAIGVKCVEDPSRFGVVEVEEGRIRRLVEKPEAFVSNLAIVGINLIRNTELLFSALEKMLDKDVRTRGEYQLTDAFQVMVDDGAELKTFDVGGWFDCGAPDALLATNRHLLKRNGPAPDRAGAILIPPVYIPESAAIENSIIGPYVSVGEDAVLKDAMIRDSIVGDGARVTGCFLERSLVGNGAVVEARPRRLNVGDSSEVSLY